MAKKKKSSKQILKSSTSGRKHLQDPKIVEPKNRRSKAEMEKSNNFPLMEAEVYKAIDWLREGKTTDWITKELCSTKNPRTTRNYAPRFVENIITTANQLIQMWYRNQIYQLEKVHVSRYNEIIVNRLNKTYHHIEMDWLRAKSESMHLDEILQAMKQKETLLGMHRKTFRLILNSQLNFFDGEERRKQVAEKKKQFNIDSLEFEEKIELLELIGKLTRTEDELCGVILRDAKKQEEVEDVEVEVIESKNIEKIDNYSNPSSQDESKGSILIDIQRKLREKSMEITNQTKK